MEPVTLEFGTGKYICGIRGEAKGFSLIFSELANPVGTGQKWYGEKEPRVVFKFASKQAAEITASWFGDLMYFFNRSEEVESLFNLLIPKPEYVGGSR